MARCQTQRYRSYTLIPDGSTRSIISSDRGSDQETLRGALKERTAVDRRWKYILYLSSREIFFLPFFYESAILEVPVFSLDMIDRICILHTIIISYDKHRNSKPSSCMSTYSPFRWAFKRISYDSRAEMERVPSRNTQRSKGIRSPSQ